MLKDSYKILTPISEDEADYIIGFVNACDYPAFYRSSKFNLRHSVNSFVYIRYLNAFDCDKAISRKEAFQISKIQCGPDNWKRLVAWHLLESAYVGKNNTTYWKLTEDGLKVLNMAKSNDPYYQVMRWYDTSLTEDDLTMKMMQEDLAGNEAWKSQTPKGFINMLDAIFNPKSLCRQVGASYRWVNKIIYMCKSRNDFFEKISCDETMAWLNDHIQYDGINNFIKFINKMKKKVNKT